MSRPLILLVFLAILSLLPGAGTAAPGSTDVSIDAKIDDDGDTLPDNTATTVGDVQSSASVNPGDSIVIDVVVDAIPSSRDFAGHNYRIDFDGTVFTITEQTHTDPAVNLIAAADGSGPLVDLSEDVPDNETGNVADRDGIPDVEANHIVAVADFGAAEQGPARGVLGRYTLEVPITAAPDCFSIDLSLVLITDSAGVEIPVDNINGATICTFPPTPTPTPTPTPAPGLGGDVDCDGQVTIVDALLIAQLMVGLIPSLDCPDLADMDEDGDIGIVDALLIAQKAVGLI